MSKDELAGWIAVASSICTMPVFVWYARWRWYRRRWIKFEELISSWASEEIAIPAKTSRDNWKCLCAIKLSEAGFSPLEIKDFLEVAVDVARGRVALERSGDIVKDV